MQTWWKDAQYAVRVVVRQPGPAALVVTTMSVGITATVVLASVVYSVLMKPLPWADAPRLVRLYETREGSTRRFQPMMTNAAYHAWQSPTPQTLDHLAAWSQRSVTLADGPEPQQLQAVSVTPGLFEMLGVRPLLGRTFAAGEEQPGATSVALISYPFWQQQFGGLPDVIGRSVRIDGRPHTIVGVMPRSFAFPVAGTRLWVPFYVPPLLKPGGGTSVSLFQAFGRLREGASVAEATREGTARGRDAAATGPVAMAVFGSTGAVHVTAVPMLEALTGDVREPLLLMLAAVVLLLLTATANVASLQLARSVSRRREFAVRLALGAGRPRVVRQLIVENIALGLMSAVVALALAAAIHRVLAAVLPVDFPRADEIAFDLPIQILALLLSTCSAVAFGLLPALAIRKDVLSALGEDSLAPVGGGLGSPVGRARAVIMAAQVAAAFVLLVAAALLVRSFLHLTDAPLGYDAGNLLTARVVLPDHSYTPVRRAQVLEEIAETVARAPEVGRVAFATTAPFIPVAALSSFPLKTRDGSTVQVQTGMQVVSAGYFAALGQRVLEGREFGPEDVATSRRVALVNREFSRRYLEARALGWTLPAPKDQSPPEIVGIVDDTVRQSVRDTPQPEMYFPATQHPLQSAILTLVVRGVGDPEALGSVVRTAVRRAAPDAPIDAVRSMDDLVGATLERPRLYGVLLAVFALSALAIAAVGLFSVLSYNVAQRTREIAVRSALGAAPRDLVGMVVRQTIVIVAAGLALGVITLSWASTLLNSFVYGVTTGDLASQTAVAGVLGLVAFVATLVPARRAVLIDPIRALRSG